MSYKDLVVVLDSDGILGLDDVQEGDILKKVALPDGRVSGPDSLVGRPLSEVERYYIEQALLLTGGKREEAAKTLGIGERTLYRAMQDWKVQDEIRGALARAGGNIEEAARTLEMTTPALERRIKKWGLQPE